MLEADMPRRHAGLMTVWYLAPFVSRRGRCPLLLLNLTALSTTPSCVCPHGSAQRVLGHCVPTLFAAEGAGVDGAVR